jgi:hypothetical protein
VRDKIEKRYTTALGQADLASNSVQGRMLEVKKATTNMAAQSRLEEIRQSLGNRTGGTGSGSAAGAVGTDQHPAIEDTPAAPSQQPGQAVPRQSEQQN